MKVKLKDFVEKEGYKELKKEFSPLSGKFAEEYKDGLEQLNEALNLAAFYGNLEAVKLLLEHGADPSSAIYSATKANNPDCVKYLLDKGANPNALDDKSNNSSYTILHHAIIWSYQQCAAYIIAAGANLETLNKDNLTPLSFAIKHNNFDIACILILFGANIQQTENLPKIFDKLINSHDPVKAARHHIINLAIHSNNVHTRNTMSYIIGHYVKLHKSPKFIKAIEAENYEVILDLIEDASQEIKNKALKKALHQNKPMLENILICYGAVDPRNQSDAKPINIAKREIIEEALYNKQGLQKEMKLVIKKMKEKSDLMESALKSVNLQKEWRDISVYSAGSKTAEAALLL
ncbi:MAG: ankyrin repeat domain-containing protein [Alphaproteobacteria bacterium]|nr:ankyrin repeat domain-containing protein [Alphaproteobacteria bacterium]OJV15121.1 MAG: hypothetical protein BGO27_06755 [Alphaproteobacteria bacterium 33-17]